MADSFLFRTFANLRIKVKDLCIQLEESAQSLEKETKARADAEAGKKRLEKALLELNAKLQATPTKSKDSDTLIASLKYVRVSA